MDKAYRNLFWNDPRYKPETKLCEEAWVEFLQTAKLIFILDKNRSREDKARPNYREPDIYSVLNKMRQDIHDELPYSKSFIAEIDKSVEREVKKEIAAYERGTGPILT